MTKSADHGAWDRWYGKTAQPFRATPVYRLRLNGPAPAAPRLMPTDLRPSNTQRGAAIIRGHWRFDTSTLSVGPEHAPWGPAFPSAHFADRLHRFEWLPDLLSIGPAGASHARALVVAWTKAFGKWDSFAWRSDVTARRITNWFLIGPTLFDPLDTTTRARLLECVGRQLRHLSASGGDCVCPVGRMHIAYALSLAGACLPEYGKYAATGLSLLESECKVLVLADGGHTCRNPELLANAMIDLAMLDDVMRRTRRALPDTFTAMRTNMAAMLRFLTAPGGHLFVANGGGSGAHGVSAAALAQHGDTPRNFTLARLSGFHRINSSPVTLFVDTGVAPEAQFARTVHVGCLAIEVHDADAPVITSCGAHADSSPAWRLSARASAAHSVLTLNDTDPVLYGNDDPTGVRIPVGPPHLSAHRIEENDQFLIECQHSGWVARHGLIYRRRLYVAKDGGRIVGDDSLFRPLSATTPVRRKRIPFTIRFHLHPGVEAAPGPDATCVWLGIKETERIWRFRCDNDIAIEPSVYAADGQRTKTHQLVIRGAAEPGNDGQSSPNRVRWGLTCTDEGPRA